MKLNARDQLILVVVLVILVWILGVLYFIKPSIEDAKKAQNTLDTKKTELLSKQKLIEDDKNLEQDVQAAFDKATETKKIFYPRAIQHVAATEVQSTFNVNEDDEQEIKNMNLTISTMGSIMLKKYIYNENAVSTTLDDIASRVDTSEIAIVNVQNIDITGYKFSFKFTSKKEDLIQFMENLINKDVNKSLVITGLSVPNIEDNEDDSDWIGTMTLEYYMVPELPTPAEVDSNKFSGSDNADAAEDTSEAS